MIASEVKNTLSEFGILDPNSDSTPSAKAMSVAVGIAHPRQCFRALPVDGEKDQRRREHAAERGNAGQRAPRPTIEFTGENLALDLEPDQQEEQRHQPVIDPMQDAEAADFDMQEFAVVAGKRRIGHNQPERGARHEHEAARSLGLGKALEGRAGSPNEGHETCGLAAGPRSYTDTAPKANLPGTVSPRRCRAPEGWRPRNQAVHPEPYCGSFSASRRCCLMAGSVLAANCFKAALPPSSAYSSNNPAARSWALTCCSA